MCYCFSLLVDPQASQFPISLRACHVGSLSALHTPQGQYVYCMFISEQLQSRQNPDKQQPDLTKSRRWAETGSQDMAQVEFDSEGIPSHEAGYDFVAPVSVSS